MTDLRERSSEGVCEFVGVWQEVWYTRARLAGQAERYRGWLRQQGHSRDEAAEMAVRFLATRSSVRTHRPHPPGGATVH